MSYFLIKILIKKIDKQPLLIATSSYILILIIKFSIARFNINAFE